jgi:hypothetical protein
MPDKNINPNWDALFRPNETIVDLHDTIPTDDMVMNHVFKRVEDMTITVALKGIDGIVLATDSQLTMSTYNTYSSKLWRLTDKIGLISAGYDSGYRHFLIDYFIHRLKVTAKDKSSNNQIEFIEIVNMFSDFVRVHTKKYIESYSGIKTAGGMDFALVGYHDGLPKIYSIDMWDIATPFVPNECMEKFYFGGVSEIGLYWAKKIDLNNLKLPCKFLKKLAVMTILETIISSSMCSEPIQMAVVDQKGYHSIANMDENVYHDNNNEIANTKAVLDPEHKWLFDSLKAYNYTSAT